jgi:hypothetical protein
MGDKPAKKKFKSYPFGYFHTDIAEVQRLSRQRQFLETAELSGTLLCSRKQQNQR